MAKPLSEQAIRRALVLLLQERLGPGDVLIEELGIEHGSARVDVALAAERLLGFEIKSDFDNLDRLARQMHAYHRVFDELTIVTTASYADQVGALLPDWWGIVVATEEGPGQLTLTQVRHAKSHARQDPHSLTALLWRGEAYKFLLEELGPVIKAKASRHAIYEAIASQVPVARIRERVLATLRTREALRHRLHIASDELANGEDQMVAGGVSTPCHEAA